MVVGAANTANDKALVIYCTNVIACFSQLTTDYSHYFELLFLFFCELMTEFSLQFIAACSSEHLVTFIYNEKKYIQVSAFMLLFKAQAAESFEKWW